MVTKIALLMALADGKITDDEMSYIRNRIVVFFELSNLLTEEEIEFLFAHALGTEKQREELYKMPFKEIQVLLVTFFLIVNDDKLKAMLVNFLAEVAVADNYISANESLLYNIYLGLLKGEKHLDNYANHLENLVKSNNSLLYSYLSKNKDVYMKKRDSALHSYAKGIETRHVLSLYDATTFGKADNGFIVTPLAIITDRADNISVIPLASIYKIDVDNKKNLIFYGKPDKQNEIIILAILQCPTDKLADFLDFLNNIIKITYGNILDIFNNTKNIKEWYLGQNGVELGLYSLQEIDEKFSKKELTKENLLAWKDGMSNWTLAIEIEELKSIIKKYTIATPPPLPTML